MIFFPHRARFSGCYPSFTENIDHRCPLTQRHFGSNEHETSLHSTDTPDPRDDFLTEITSLVKADRELVQTQLCGKLSSCNLVAGYGDLRNKLMEANLVVVDPKDLFKRVGLSRAEDEVATRPVETTAFHSAAALNEMVDESELPGLVNDLAVIGNQITLKTGMNRLALRQLTVEDETVPVGTDVHECLDLAFEIAEAGGNRLAIKGAGNVVTDLTVEITNAVRPCNAKNSAVAEREPSPGEGGE